MVLIAGVKYACERCIRGHRVTTCNHTDQPLMLIKPKGRPSSQCKHCKEMRKNKNSHSTGSCTCSKVKKASTAASAPKTCGCDTSKPCTCHGKRIAKSDTVKKTSSRSSSIISVNIPPQGSDNKGDTAGAIKGVTVSPNSKSSAPASQGQFRQIGLDPLIKARPISQNTRTRVGEVSVPLNEYIPNSSANIGNASDRIPDGFFQDVPLPFELGHGLLDLFSDTNILNANNSNKRSSSAVSSNSSFFTDTQSQGNRAFSPSSFESQRLASPLEKPGVGSTPDFFQYYPMQHSQSTSTNNVNSNTDIQRNTPVNTNSSSSSRTPLQYSASSDSLASQMSASAYFGGNKQMASNRNGNNSNNNNNNNNNNSSNNNYHQYSNMLHNKPLNLNKSLFSNLEDITDNDASSIHSVEVLSLTPSFMDLSQTDKAANPTEQSTKSITNNNNNHNNNHNNDYFELNSSTSLNNLYSNNNFVNSSENFFSPTVSNYSQNSNSKPVMSHKSSNSNTESPDFLNQASNSVALDFDPSSLLGNTTSPEILNGMATANLEDDDPSKTLFGNLKIPM